MLFDKILPVSLTNLQGEAGGGTFQGSGVNCNFVVVKKYKKNKSQIQETRHLLIGADSRTDTILERSHDLYKKKIELA